MAGRGFVTSIAKTNENSTLILMWCGRRTLVSSKLQKKRSHRVLACNSNDILCGRGKST
jgi:hypothetical protein